jgi:transposase
MLKVQLEKWQQTAETLRELALHAQHPRTRERLLAIYEIAQGESATQVAYQSDRNPQTVMEWVHRYNANGPQALTYQHSGGHPPLCQMRLGMG